MARHYLETNTVSFSLPNYRTTFLSSIKQQAHHASVQCIDSAYVLFYLIDACANSNLKDNGITQMAPSLPLLPIFPASNPPT